MQKVLILGDGRSGKDTVADLLSRLFGYRVVSSSFFAAERVMMPFFGDKYATVEDCFADRHTGNNREVWYNQIQAYNTPDKSRLAREILEISDVYVGMRSNEELAEARPLFDKVIWVDASRRGVSREGRGSFTIDYDPESMLLLDNNGTLEDLEANVRRMVENW